MSIRPNCSSVSWTIRSQSASLVISAVIARPSDPAARTRSSVASQLSRVRPATATLAPAPASASASDDPMPPPPPATMATRPTRLKMSSCLIVLLQDGGASPRLSRAQATLYPTTRATMILNLDGLIAATVLPMHADGSIDETALRSYIGWVADQGPVALAINVDTGEGPHLTHDEKARVLRVVREVTDLPIVAGLAGPSTDAAVRQARDFKAAGADALLVFPIPAYLSEPLDVRVPVSYHEAIAGVGLPMILFQLQPALAGLNYEPDTLRAMAAVEGVVAIKEASFDARRFVDTARLIAQLPRPITLLTGNDNFILESFMLGATGALIGFGAVMTREQVDMIDAWNAGRIDDAVALGRRVQRLADLVFARPVGDYRVRLKECLRILGVLEAAHVRLPLAPPPQGVSRGHRTRRCPHRRRRRHRWRRGPPPRPGRVPCRLPGAGRLARSVRVPRRRARLGTHHAQAVGDQSERPGAARGLPDRRERHRGLAPHVLGGRRLDADLRWSLAEDAALGLPRALARWHRGRLAAGLRRAAPLLRAERPAVRRVGDGRRPPGLPAGRGAPAAAAAAHRRRRPEGRPGPCTAGLALVAGAEFDPV